MNGANLLCGVCFKKGEDMVTFKELKRAIKDVQDKNTRGHFFVGKDEGFAVVDWDTFRMMETKEWDKDRTELVKENRRLKDKFNSCIALLSES